MCPVYIELLKSEKEKLAAQAEELNTKITIYMERDELAAAIHATKLKEVDERWLEVDAEIQAYEKNKQQTEMRV